MDLKLGENIKALRKAKNISQEVLAQYLGVSFQAVSKWENGAALPDVTLIPAIALFFGVSTDQLFDINLLEIEKQIDEIRFRAADCRDKDPEEAEQILRDGLKKFPGNDILLNNLLYVLRGPERRAERITICKSIIEGTRDDEVKYDAHRILAKTYQAIGEYELAKAELERIPELYFTKLQIQALLLEGEDIFKPAYIQKNLAAEMLVDMFLRLANYYEWKGQMDMA
ncbi:MAG: helix-turn-helix domain-containing protein, partial [Oscillospiraceae bacterium]|nr:helix-turn-helix domain-containing protein [Oscillospiraceae bacterium]